MKNARRILLRLLLAMVLVAATGLAHAQPSSPTVSTLPATAVGITTATLNGIGNPHFVPAFGFFEWGTTTNYGNVTPAQPLGSGSGTLTANGNATGALAWGDIGEHTAHLWAMSSNQGIQAFLVVVPSPVLSPARLNCVVLVHQLLWIWFGMFHQCRPADFPDFGFAVAGGFRHQLRRHEFNCWRQEILSAEEIKSCAQSRRGFHDLPANISANATAFNVALLLFTVS